ncbi:DNA polymerase/3'-5' exonuclease PolX [Bacillus solitudinis]|uniref:DNA polymerase/3'-5' exonuclease PolX n=1 Tax=Bacillus solitudinis TaxID=2014074 RepID=UPI000C24BB6F|nr:DNA polymerase/3'-5' exonuclease PolX [Bacillus solitudinis]
MNVNKKDVLKVLETIAIYLEIKGENTFKVSAYRKAAQALETDERTLDEINDPSTLKGIGKGTAEVINEFAKTGESSLLEELKNELPAGLLPLLKLSGLGGKKVGKLYQELGIIDSVSLKLACEQGEVRDLAGFGKKTEEKILQALEEFNTRPDRLALPLVIPVAEKIENQLECFEKVEQFSRAGSLRRLRETVKDLDFIIATDDPTRVREQLLELDNITTIIASGETKVSIEVISDFPISVDFRLVTPAEFATTLHHFTGSKDHNVKLRQIAKARGEKISEYGVENVETGDIKTFKTEEAFFQYFDLPFIPPEARENQGEIERFQTMTNYVTLDKIKADLHMHTTWSDGAQSIEDMVNAARARGYRYIAITDHSKFLRVANGLTEERLREQHTKIRALNEQLDDFTIFTGIEMDILPDGSLDYSDEVLAEIDFVIASIHSSFTQSKEVIMNRLKTALMNPHVDLIAHPTGRLLGRRDGYDLDVEALIKLAKETNTALELNANPHRLDLSAHWLKRAEEAGVILSINTDAHNYSMLEHMKYGTGLARKAMLNADNVLNTWSVDRFRTFLKR